MRLNRADPLINDAIEALDQRLRNAVRMSPKSTPDEQKNIAWASLSPSEMSFVQQEITRCIEDRVYYLQNYHVIRPEQGPLTCLYPFRDHQNMVEETLVKLIEHDGQARIIILKERQSGMTEYCCGVMCWRTFFLPDAFTVTVAQDPGTSAAAQRKIVLAHTSLPWWLKPELMYFTKGEYIELGRKDAARSVDPGLGSVFSNTHAMKGQGVAIGRTVRSLHASEVSRWPSGEVFTGDIEPSMNATDTIAFMESTALGADGFFYNLWQEAMDGDSEWTPVFLAAYRDHRRKTPIAVTNPPFALTETEASFTERVKRESGFVIEPEFWNWRRRRIKASISRTGFPYAHYESFPITPQEAFQSSGQGAFPRHKLDEQQQTNVCNPEWVGEILYQGRGTAPKVLLNHMHDERGDYRSDVRLEKRELTNRLYVWEQPQAGRAYYVGVDVGDGIVGSDYSVIEVFRAGYGLEPDMQVAEWVGYESPLAFAKIIHAMGTWYNECEVAVEYAREGMACANALRLELEYPSLYRPRRPDKATGSQFTTWFHWQTTSRTKPYLMTRMTESLLEGSIVIRSQYLLDELRHCVKDGSAFAGLGSHDDAAVAGCIAHYCLRETMPELRQSGAQTGEPSAPKTVGSYHAPVGTLLYGVYDELFRLRHQRRSLAEAETDCAAHPGWVMRPIRASKVNTAYSVIRHGNGLEREMFNAGMRDRDISPAMVTEYAAATNRLQGMFRADGAASPGADAGQWDSAMGEFSGDLSAWSELG